MRLEITFNYKNSKGDVIMKKYAYRLKVKIGKKWKHGLVSYPTVELAQARLDELVALGHPKSQIKIQPESEIFC